MLDISQEITVFVLTVGDEANLCDCLTYLDKQTVHCRREIINNVAPMSAALQAMIDRCTTPYFIQVDEDMLLYPHAALTLYRVIESAPSDVALFCAGLWDAFLQIPIHGVKSYKHEIMKRFPYRNTFSCEWTQILDLHKAGYRYMQTQLVDRSSCLGEHGRHQSSRAIFTRFQRLAQKHRRYNHMQWLEMWPRQLLERVYRSRDDFDLFALLGMIAGMTGELPADTECDYREPSEDFVRIQRYFSTH